ncbi:MAG TPA: hypothetical protein VGI27_06295, partial [Solirubrobacteraceae bacterium]
GAAGSAVPAASAVIDLRNSRRFITTSSALPLEVIPQGPCQSRAPRGGRLNSAQAIETADVLATIGHPRGGRVWRSPLHTIRRFESNF